MCSSMKERLTFVATACGGIFLLISVALASGSVGQTCSYTPCGGNPVHGCTEVVCCCWTATGVKTCTCPGSGLLVGGTCKTPPAGVTCKD